MGRTWIAVACFAVCSLVGCGDDNEAKPRADAENPDGGDKEESCASPEDCDDTNVCNGVETCDVASGECRPGTSLVCSDDGDPCTAEACDPGEGCKHVPLDRDGDGDAPAIFSEHECGGTDCNDFDPDVSGKKHEVCDGKDNDCDKNTDEGVTSQWWLDCDGDTFAPEGARSVLGCTAPAPEPSCGLGGVGAWTPIAPNDVSLRDCWDADARVKPYSPPDSSPWFTDAAIGDGGFDYNCNGETELHVRKELVECVRECDPEIRRCLCFGGGTEGFVDGVPECGQSGTWVQCVRTTCARRTMTVPQECR